MTPSLAKEHLHFSFVVLRFKQKNNILGIGLHDPFQSVELSGNSSCHGNISNSKCSYMGLGPFQAGYLHLNMRWSNCTDPFPSVNNGVAILGSLGAAFSLVCISGWTHTKTVAQPFILAKSLNLSLGPGAGTTTMGIEDAFQVSNFLFIYTLVHCK